MYAGGLASGAERARWGVSTGSSIMINCTTGYCQGDPRDVHHSMMQSFGTNVVSDSQTDFGIARASVEMVRINDAFFPKIFGEARTIGPDIHWASASGTGVEGYQYRGGGAGDLEFVATLCGTNASSAGMTAMIYLFKSEGFVYQTHLPTLLYETQAKPITNFTLSVSKSATGSTNSATIQAQPGEIIYLFAQLSMSAQGAGRAVYADEGLRVTCKQADLLLSESLFAPQLAFAKQSGKLNLWIPATRWPVSIESSTDLGTDWSAVPVITTTSGTSASLVIQGPQRFFRVGANY